MHVYLSNYIHIFTQIAISLPGIARYIAYNAAKAEGTVFPLIGEHDFDLYKMIQINVSGGEWLIMLHALILEKISSFYIF